MIAAIYARKSTDQSGVADEAKSVERQTEHARAYALKKGWTVADDCIFVDDGISGAEFSNRPGFLRLMNALTPRPPFQVLVMSEESRLGRESIETAFSMKQLVQAGVRVFFYLTDTERTLDCPMDKVMLSLATFADELERKKGRQRTYDAMQRKARAGHVTGGLVFGYDNVPVVTPTGKKSHVMRRVNETHAAIVREIFDRYASGWGYSRIAKALNAVHAPSPRPTEDKPAGWSPSSVRCILRRDLYRGVITWNRSQKRDKWGRQRQKARPQSEWMIREAPELQIVSDVLWTAAQVRLTRTRAMLPTTQGPRSIVRRDIGSRFVLSGFARYATCGWSMTVVTRRHGTTRKAFLGCLSHYKRGPHVCPNGRVVPLDRAVHSVLGTLDSDTLDPRVVATIIDLVFAQLTPANAERNVEALQRELRAIDGKIANLTSAVENGGAGIDALIAQLRDRQQERERLIAAIAAARVVDDIHVDRAAIEARVQAQVANWRALLTESVEDGRQLLREVLTEPLVFTPTAEGYHFRGGVATGELIAGAVAETIEMGAGAQKGSSPPGGDRWQSAGIEWIVIDHWIAA